MNAAIRLAICSLAVAVLAVSVLPAIAQEGAAGPRRTSPAPQPEVYRYGLGNPTVYRYAMPYICAYAPPGIAMRIGSILDRYASIGPMPQVPRAMPYSYSPHANQPIGHEKIWTGPNSYVYRPLYAGAPATAGSSAAAKPEASLPVKPQTPTIARPGAPTPAAPSTRPGAVQAGFAASAAAGAATVAVPEVIPTPPAIGSAIKGEPTFSAPQMSANESLNGPREF